MFKFLFKKRGDSIEARIETQRAQFERLTEELNALIALQGDKPKITLDPATGHIAFDLPEQMADEALALPAPAEVETPESDTTEPAEDVAKSDDAKSTEVSEKAA